MAGKQYLVGAGISTYLYQENTMSSATGVNGPSQLFSIVTSSSSGAQVTGTAQLTIDPSTNGNIVLTPNGSGTVNINYATPNAMAIYGTNGSLLSTAALTNGQMVIGSTGSAPVAGTITSTGGTITVTTGAGTLNLETSSGSATSFPTDSGTATPSAGVLNVLGGTSGRDIATSGSGDTVHIDLKNAITLGDLSSIIGSAALTATTGDVTITAGNINMPTTSSTVGIYKVNSTHFMHSYGTQNTFLGAGSGNFTLSGSGSVGIGDTALAILTSGIQNTCVGSGAGSNLQAGGQNTAVGFGALQIASTAVKNTAVGDEALNLANGNGNTALGMSAASNITSGTYNIAIGSWDNTMGNNGPLYELTTGSYNIGIGSGITSVNPSGAGISYTGSESSNICIGSLAIGVLGESNVLRIGASGSGTGQQNKCFIAGTYGVTPGVAAPLSVVIDSNGQLGTSGSAHVAWSVITANQTAAVNNGYFCNKAGTLALALPATSAVGDVIEVININTATGVQFTQAANQQIFFSTVSTTLGATGTLTSSAVGDSLRLVCRTANLVWWAASSIGNWTPA